MYRNIDTKKKSAKEKKKEYIKTVSVVLPAYVFVICCYQSSTTPPERDYKNVY